jgi:hypothetical protein
MLIVRRRTPGPLALKMAVGLLIVLAVAQTTWHLAATAQWLGYTRVFREELQRQPGFVPFETTALSRERVGVQALRGLTWNYTNPYMSIALAPAGSVSSIIGVPQGAGQLFDPRDPKVLPRLTRIGVDYSAYVQALAPR